MTINLNTNKQTIKELVQLGVTNYYFSSPLCIQRVALLRDAAKKNLITLNK
tara:strand:- start:330 stop:482 length:153 start_codon:yes stop_codon:yes gene_type:complete